MAFRTGKKGVFSGIGGPCLIEQERLTLPDMLKEKGYSTACFGKWHIGMTFFDKNGKPLKCNKTQGIEKIDYSRAIPDGPINQGFDQFFGTVNCPTTDWFYAYVEGDQVPIPPDRLIDKKELPKHPYANDCRAGMIAPGFNHEEVDLVFLEKSRGFLENHTRNSPDKPFFLYHSAQAVHLPSLPAEQFKGKSIAGPHGDFIFELDYIVGQLMKTLDRLGIADNTIVMFSSDNGPEVTTVYHMRKGHDHDGARALAGNETGSMGGRPPCTFYCTLAGKS